MPSETARPIDVGNVYRDTEAEYVNYVVIDGFYVDEAGDTQVRIRQYTDTPLAAHNSASHLTGVSGRLTVTVNDIRERILLGELMFVDVSEE